MPDEIPTEALQAAARALRATWWHANTPINETEHQVRIAVAAAAPYLIAEGRRQRDQELFTGVLSLNPELTEPDDETLALMARYERELRAKIAAEIRAAAEREEQPKIWTHILDSSIPEWAAQIAEGFTPAERAERALRESRERQAGLDYERIERARARIVEGTDRG